VEADYLNPSVSDHSPILIKYFSYTTLHPRPFRFYPNIMEHPDFRSTMNQVGDGDHWTAYGVGLGKIEAIKGETKRYKQIYGCIFTEITCSKRET